MFLSRNSKLIKSIVIVFLYFSVVQSAVYGKEHTLNYRLNKEYFRYYLNDFKDIVVSPGHWQRSDLLEFSAILGSSLLLFTVDENINSWVLKHQNSGASNLSRAFSILGSGYFLGSALAGLYLSGEIGKDNNIRKIALISLESWLLTGAIVSSAKFILGRARPYKDEGSLSFHPFSLKSGFYSFPSGHAASAFAVATVVAQQSQRFYIDFLAYSLATLASLSRVYGNKHWASDVFLGGVAGYVVAQKILGLHKQRQEKKLRVYFEFSSQQQSIIFCFDF